MPLLLARVSHGGLAGLLSDGALLLPPLLFLILVAVGLALAGRSLARQVLASRRLACRVRGLARVLPDQLARPIMQAGLGGRVVLVDARESFSFVYGVLTPASRSVAGCSRPRRMRSCVPCSSTSAITSATSTL